MGSSLLSYAFPPWSRIHLRFNAVSAHQRGPGQRPFYFWSSANGRSVFAESRSIAHYASLRETWASVPLDRPSKQPSC